MTNYQQGKIYKIEAINGDENDDIYIGSTTQQYLSQRMEKHRSGYKSWKEEKRNYVTSFGLFDKHGVDNCRIVLIEVYPCNIKEELHAREAFHIRATKNVNKYIPLRTDKEYREDNKESIIEYRKKNYEENRIEFIEKAQTYYTDNKEDILEKRKEYYKENLEDIREKQKNFYQENKEEMQEKNREYKSLNKEKISAWGKIYYEDNKAKLVEKSNTFYKDNYDKINEKNNEIITCDCGTVCNRSSLSRHKKTVKHIEYVKNL